MKVVIGLSGGMDSATLLGYFLEQGAEVHCCIFTYGSKHNLYENTAAIKIIQYYQEAGFPVFEHKYDLISLFEKGSSALLKSGGEIPEGHYNDDNMKLTVVPGRNLIFASIMASLAEAIGAGKIGLGVHSGDHHIYPDCRPEFISALKSVVKFSTDSKVDVVCPLEYANKTSILLMGNHQDPPVPYYLTRTCYKDQEEACGKCGSCQERLEAFSNIGLKDPIKYQE